ncbi:MAG TPA: YegS/Rv2252/BmrU family lipid kinase [Bacteroidales bacterium]|nr:YegS/Rv2252/BmrU family lipid kinase [Bacteroidales bacterium]HOK75336.1 YegS/Rv2252/BmrU family lipid kinase [Bacteroidales bacterium]HOM41869.1 YegS/Rv2252/BmrU family lipid kinase [Bacteroidales bacterium]HOU31259.1 YegS/Rv2252/BmrU family lipid kinase [Bacteroidales bacterium]HPP93668.1 YegS/Rv2252/BmrU family lipid kinase [Bacteroidales bacterium]
MKWLKNNNTLIIINPRAGRKRIIEVSERIKKFSNLFDYAVFYDVNEFRNFIRENINNYEIFVAAGGDGTVNSLATELAGNDKTLAVLPVGSGNGFAREMGFRKSIRKLIKDIEYNKTFYTDVLYVNGIPCINVFGLGIDSYVAHDFSNSEKRGFWSYVVALLKIISSIKPVKVKVDIDGKQIEEEVFMFSVTNTRQFGNHAIITPAAAPNDGKLNVVIARPFPKIFLPLFAAKLMTGTLKESKYVSYFETDNPVTIETSETRFHIDGEPVKIDSPITVTIRKNALKVLVTRRNKWMKKKQL